MSTSATLTSRPAPFAAAAAAVAAVALALAALSIADHSGGSVGPGDPVQQVVGPQHGSGHFEYSSSGGKVMTGD
jgi:hypothetical protein